MTGPPIPARGWEIRIVDDLRPRRKWRHRLFGESGRRLRIAAVVIAALVTAGTVDGMAGRAGPLPEPPSTATAAAAAATGSVVSSPNAESSAWFCVGGSGAGSVGQVTLELTNSTAHVVSGTISAVPVGGPSHSVPVSIPPHDQVGVAPAQSGAGPWLGASILLEGGGVAASEVVVGPFGWSISRCASSTSSDWYLPHGSTASGATMSLCLYNPLTTDAVVDVTLDTSTSGVVEPPAYQGIPVPAGTLVVENIADHVMNDPSIGAEILATSGAVVASELQSTPQRAGGAGGGSSDLLGVPAPARSWEFPQNVDLANGSVVFHVLNPTSQKESVRVGIGLAQGQAEPLTLEVGPHSVSDLVAAQQTRIPPASPYELTFVASGGPGIVVDREIFAPAGATSPVVGLVHGEPGGASRSLLPALGAPASSATVLAISDVATHAVTVTVLTASTGRPVPGLLRRVILPGRPLIVVPPPDSTIGLAPLIVDSTGAVATELDVGPNGANGIAVLPQMILP